MKGSVEHVLVARELIVRTGRHLVVLTLPLVCWLAGQEGPAQLRLAWAVQRGMALLTTLRTAARAKENFDIPALAEDGLDEINRIQTRLWLNEVMKTGIPGVIPKGA
jgi:alcohol dehydrogenase (NADP+)